MTFWGNHKIMKNGITLGIMFGTYLLLTKWAGPGRPPVAFLGTSGSHVSVFGVVFGAESVRPKYLIFKGVTRGSPNTGRTEMGVLQTGILGGSY